MFKAEHIINQRKVNTNNCYSIVHMHSSVNIFDTQFKI